jgi:hypothetical protein
MIILDDHIAKVHTNPSLDPLFRRTRGVVGRLRLLDRLRTTDGVDHTVELAKDGVARRIDHPPFVRLDERPGARVELTDKRGGTLLIPPHHPAEAGDIDHQDRRELTTRCGSFSCHTRSSRGSLTTPCS